MLDLIEFDYLNGTNPDNLALNKVEGIAKQATEAIINDESTLRQMLRDDELFMSFRRELKALNDKKDVFENMLASKTDFNISKSVKIYRKRIKALKIDYLSACDISVSELNYMLHSIA